MRQDYVLQYSTTSCKTGFGAQVGTDGIATIVGTIIQKKAVWVSPLLSLTLSNFP